MFLDKMSKILIKVLIGVHPSSKDTEKYFSKFIISKERTMDLIHKSEIIVVTHSSLISMMAMLKKNNFNKIKIFKISSRFL